MMDFLDGIIVVCAKSVGRFAFGLARLLVYVQFFALLVLVAGMVGGIGYVIWRLV
ncbi:hypothetical protein LXM94_25630 [Rhizobium sp. TRM95111]|uniref:hypothetical protein n=1 Tax=Rhizobium alarense TaxID=2846851 RepID=UPI001F1D53EB|nr:hypothetical protein [Rhizobium alarense]MCF3643338.1 hypothetical protein [Rhizobium alarense]